MSNGHTGMFHAACRSDRGFPPPPCLMQEAWNLVQEFQALINTLAMGFSAQEAQVWVDAGEENGSKGGIFVERRGRDDGRDPPSFSPCPMMAPLNPLISPLPLNIPYLFVNTLPLKILFPISSPRIGN